MFILIYLQLYKLNFIIIMVVVVVGDREVGYRGRVGGYRGRLG